ncbi:MAG: hypothetical protein EBU90_02250 [Proteobacteria bacterium]|nr:hypothetical protein [Pseudomonadota bacterium]NBP13056.1 hypothetical protein [bacterium]
MSNIDYRLFIGRENNEPLPPIFKGKKNVLIYPGDLNDNIKAKLNKYRSNGRGQKSGLRRYIFKYVKGTFEYQATRFGQRNGGFNSTLNQTLIQFKVDSSFPDVPTLSAFPVAEQFKYGGVISFDSSLYGGTKTETYFAGASANSVITYNNTLNRWEWNTRPPAPPPLPTGGPFYLTAYTSSTTKSLRDASTSNGITWTLRRNPGQIPNAGVDPERVATVKIKTKQWFNNNTVANLNRWPIQNQDADRGKRPSQEYKWQNHRWTSSTTFVIERDGRPDCLSDEFLFKCFKGIELKEYETVFVEVVWRYMQNMCNYVSNMSPPQQFYKNAPIYRGYNLHNEEWFSPKPFYTKRQKGRVYRVGKLAKSNSVGEYDTVTFAQRTRIVTTKWYRGGNTALE